MSRENNFKVDTLHRRGEARVRTAPAPARVFVPLLLPLFRDSSVFVQRSSVRSPWAKIFASDERTQPGLARLSSSVWPVQA